MQNDEKLLVFSCDQINLHKEIDSLAASNQSRKKSGEVLKYFAEINNSQHLESKWFTANF